MGTNDVILKRTVPVDVDSARLASVSHFVLALYTRGRRRAEDGSGSIEERMKGACTRARRQAGPGCLSLRRERRDCRTRARARSALAHLLEGAAVGSAKRARLRPECRAPRPLPRPSLASRRDPTPPRACAHSIRDAPPRGQRAGRVRPVVLVLVLLRDRHVRAVGGADPRADGTADPRADPRADGAGDPRADGAADPRADGSSRGPGRHAHGRHGVRRL